MATEYLAGTISGTSALFANLNRPLIGSVTARGRINAYLYVVPQPYFDQETEHLSSALSNLLEQFKEKPVFASLLQGFIDRVQNLEDTLFDLLLQRFLDTSIGAQLDGIGAVVGEARQNRSDGDYKRGILTRILLNLGQSTPEDVIEIMSRYARSDVSLTEYYPADFVLTILRALDPTDLDSDGTPDEVERLSAYLQSAKPAAVGAGLVYGLSETNELFRFDSGPGYDGGLYAGVI